MFFSLGDPGSISSIGRVGSHPTGLASPYCTRGKPSPDRAPELRVTPTAGHAAPANREARSLLWEWRKEMQMSAEVATKVSWFEK